MSAILKIQEINENKWAGLPDKGLRSFLDMGENMRLQEKCSFQVGVKFKDPYFRDTASGEIIGRLYKRRYWDVISQEMYRRMWLDDKDAKMRTKFLVAWCGRKKKDWEDQSLSNNPLRGVNYHAYASYLGHYQWEEEMVATLKCAADREESHRGTCVMSESFNNKHELDCPALTAWEGDIELYKAQFQLAAKAVKHTTMHLSRLIDSAYRLYDICQVTRTHLPEAAFPNDLLNKLCQLRMDGRFNPSSGNYTDRDANRLIKLLGVISDETKIKSENQEGLL